jgi:hypothetical protein
MKTYILFVFGMFDDHEDVEYFCSDVLGDNPIIDSVRYVIENSQNIIVIFDSDSDYKTISTELFSILSVDQVKFYFIFDRDSLVTAHLPKEVKELKGFVTITLKHVNKNKTNIKLIDLKENATFPEGNFEFSPSANTKVISN